MPTFKLNGTEVPFEQGDTILRAAWRQGVEIPHYCWHPGLSVAANCRMCLVEIKAERPMSLPVLRWDEATQSYVDSNKPKLQPSCQILATEGMEVSSVNENVTQAQKAVQEFLLLNHPVDCPICDQAGECKLQDYWLDHQASLKRKKTEPVHKPKAVRFGPTIVYDAERCIMCTRCIRFCDEIAHDHVLDMRERGNRNEIVVSPGRELDHRYTLMTEHVCPVGALTSRDFRFKARVWFLRSVSSVCNGCATGCNTFMDFDPRTQKVERLRPRDNLQVNDYWMCDDGMMTYKRLYEQRMVHGRVGRGADAQSVPVEHAAGQAAVLLAALIGSQQGEKIGVVLSAQHSTEDNAALVKFAERSLGATALYLAAQGGWEGDNILRDADNNPNRAGVQQAAGRPLASLSQLALDAQQGKVTAVIALGWAADEPGADLTAIEKLETVISLTSHQGSLPNAASVVIPVAAHGEVAGSFINRKGIAQSFQAAVKPPPGVRSALETIQSIESRMTGASQTRGGAHGQHPHQQGQGAVRSANGSQWSEGA
jgi:NADH-quinone oxidoreductase subunit G